VHNNYVASHALHSNFYVSLPLYIIDELGVEVLPALIRAPMKRMDSTGEDSAIGTSIRTCAVLTGDGISTCSEVCS
jgi:hypothetical protein